MLSKRSLELITQYSAHMKKPVRLILFMVDRGCPACPEALDLVRAIKNHMGKIVLETYDLVMDRDKSEHYGITKTPSIVVEGGDGQAVTFSGLIEGVFLETLMNTIQLIADSKVWFPEDVRRTLTHLAHEVRVRVFVESDCPLCRPVADTAIGLALESRLIFTDIIVASDFPELIQKHKITLLPKTIFGENLHLDGHVSEGEFLEMIFQAEGVKAGPDRRCLTCGNPSPDIICLNCKNRIRAEAVDHKTRIEKGSQQP